MKLSLLIPVYNERTTVAELLDRVAAVDLSPLGLERELIVVDDGSTDGAAAVLQQYLARHPDYPIRCITLPRNRGKGFAVRTALAAATGDLCLIQDADLEYDPRDWPVLLEPLVKGEAVAVFGSRQALVGTDQRRRQFYQIGLIIAQFVMRRLYVRPPRDVATCYKAMRTELLRSLQLASPRFAVDMEITCKLLNRGVAIAERLISYKPRYKSEGKKIRWRDFFSSMWAIFYYRFFG